MRTRLLIALVVCGLLLTGCVQATPAPAPTEVVRAPTAEQVPTPTAEPTPEPVALFEEAPCPFDLPDGHVEGETVECGYLAVPEKRGDPDSRTIRLAVAIFRHPDGASRPDPIIYLEGGPGGSPLKVRVPEFDAVFGGLFAAGRDIILFDQRGVGYSEPALDCPDFTELYFDLLDMEVDGERLTSQQVLDRKVEGFMACAEDLRESADVTAYNTAENAADVDDLRRALGYDQANLYGASYGTRLAFDVMRDFPEGVRSVVLDAPYPPEVDAYRETPASFDRALNEIAGQCAADTACNDAYPDLRTVLFDAVERLNEEPASFPVTHPVTGQTYTRVLNGDGLLELVFRSLYDTLLRPVMPQAIYDASEGVFTAFLRTIAIDMLRQDWRSWGMYFSVQCHDEVAFSSWEEFEAVADDYPEFAGFFLASEIGKLTYDVCAGWGAGKADPVENQPVSSDIPTLITTGQYDPIVPPQWGRGIAENLTNGYFFVFPGIGHGAGADSCSQSMMLSFLDDPTTAPSDACIADIEPVPFVVPAEAAEIEIEPFTSEDKGISGVAPVGWTEVGPGAFARASSAVDPVGLIHDVAPVDAETLLGAIVQQLGLVETPESTGEREANDLTWTLYVVEIQGIGVDLALAEHGEVTLLVVLQAPTSERDALCEAVFLPAVDGLVPLE